MLISILLQDLEIPWGNVADHGLSFGILAVAVYVLWKRDSAMNDKMNKYLEEDRKEMLRVIQNNTKAFEDLCETIGKLAEK